MLQFGLTISILRSEQETTHPIPDLGLFVIYSQGNVQIVDISNNPYVRPDVYTLINGLTWILNPVNNYFIRSTYQNPLVDLPLCP